MPVYDGCSSVAFVYWLRLKQYLEFPWRLRPIYSCESLGAIWSMGMLSSCICSTLVFVCAMKGIPIGGFTYVTWRAAHDSGKGKYQLSAASPASQFILQHFRRFTYVTANSPTLALLHLGHSSFSNPSLASSTPQALYLRHLASRPCIKSKISNFHFHWNYCRLIHVIRSLSCSAAKKTVLRGGGEWVKFLISTIFH